ncbi:flagellar FlbD family protein [Hydrogenibacillus schlegelii]|uniref:Flagellar FlbD family protein n=1 Tax=Hydrogenibacillus schlegelii TaxID=1484 RepID=A0A132NE69_HYDSH|nr:flagellar FlbD family protein [Hydrogenibacillus schlegelii]KWX08297.1 hypothetical protein TR75_00855 [Hydrogenibacillus schlegelii]MBT9281449.1 flagellar FlbD family protein [Hydrogenibacillus schlegelii]OAR04707.1 hypothetical protein SA87_09300 [Hydrogenibacillus schlegelii]PTQ54951.1 MAG: hypothetical protein HSCHL_1894 [Hydrogenibacillus schlegelii]
MLELSRRSGERYYLNPLLIETVEATPDTVITLVTGKKLVVRESADEVVRRFVAAVRDLAPGGLFRAPTAGDPERGGASVP